MMKQSDRWLTAGILLFGLQGASCQRHSGTVHAEHPAEVKKIDGSEFSRVTLTVKAMERIDLKTDEVREQRVARSASLRSVVPYSSLIYDPLGRTWVYTSPEPGTFVRHRVEVDYVEGGTAILQSGPPIGTKVASVGVAELYGTEFQVGH